MPTKGVHARGVKRDRPKLIAGLEQAPVSLERLVQELFCLLPPAPSR